jgi:hypothetical protein
LTKNQQKKHKEPNLYQDKKLTEIELQQMTNYLLAQGKKKESQDLRPIDQPKRAVVGISRKERKKIIRAGERLLNRLTKKNKWEKEQESK